MPRSEQRIVMRGRPFQKGQSGNPGGRPKGDLRLRELARERTEAALDTLTEIMNSETVPPAVRLSAACAILDRGYGRPGQQSDETARNEKEVTLVDLVMASLEPRGARTMIENTSRPSVAISLLQEAPPVDGIR